MDVKAEVVFGLERYLRSAARHRAVVAKILGIVGMVGFIR